MKDVAKPPDNCWKVVTAERLAFIIDGEAYFRALHEAMREARRSIWIVGWDVHSELRLVRNGDAGGYPETLGALLDRLVAERNRLRVAILIWDFAMIYALEREFFPRYKLKWRTHERIDFCLDGEHPIGASQHQKIVVIDDAVAFVGGLDLGKWRWDTSAHRPDDERRVDPDGKTYPPFHDVQAVMDGEGAAALGELVRHRWERARGGPPAIADSVDAGDPWPSGVAPDFENVPVAIARTLPEYKDDSEVREAEQLYLDSIAAASRFIYAENQYLSSYRIGEALASRLGETDGPEVVLVLPRKTGGWLEQHTMDVLRGRIMRRLREADRQDRLRVYYPRLSVDPDVDLMVHAKVMVIDDRFVRVGSSNLSNRSLGLDSECDIAVAAEVGTKEAAVISGFRCRLIAEHLGVGGNAVAEAVEASGSLIRAIESLRRGERTLEPLDADVPEDIDRWVPDADLLDPEKPVEPETLLDRFVGPDQQVTAFRRLLKIALLLAVFLGMAAVWRWTAFGQWVDVESATAAAAWINAQPFTPLLVPAAYVLGGLTAFPLTLMILATGIIFGPWLGVVYALAGAELSALLVFVVGRWLGRDTVSRFSGGLLNRLNKKLAESGLVAVIFFRIVPVAPFSVVNVIAGVSGIRIRDFALGSLIGLLPGTIAMVVIADRISEVLRRPDAASMATLLGAAIFAGLGLFGLRRWMRRRKPGATSNSDGA